MVAMSHVTELMHHHLVNHCERSHQAFPVELHISIDQTRCPAVGQVLNLYFARRYTHAAGEVSDACSDARKPYDLKKILKRLLPALAPFGFNDRAQ